MSDDGQTAIHHYSHALLTAFVRWLEDHETVGLPVAIPPFLASPSAQGLMTAGVQQLHQVSPVDVLIAQRGDPFQRLMTHPFSDAFEAGELSRDIIPGYFSFLHLVLGDARETIGQQCADIVAELKDSARFTWDTFYEDPRSQVVLWNTLARIAESFRRFDARRDWFIGLMQNRPHAVSLGAHAFVPLSHTHQVEEAHPFGLHQFTVLFRCLYLPLRDLSDTETKSFLALFGAVPELYFQGIYRNLGQ